MQTIFIFCIFSFHILENIICSIKENYSIKNPNYYYFRRNRTFEYFLNKNEVYLKDYNLTRNNTKNKNKNQILMLLLNKIITDKNQTLPYSINNEYEEIKKHNISVKNYNTTHLFLNDFQILLDKIINCSEKKFLKKKNLIYEQKNDTNKLLHYKEFIEEYKIELNLDELNFYTKLIKLKLFIEKLIHFEELKRQSFGVTENNSYYNRFTFKFDKSIKYRINYNRNRKNFQIKIICFNPINSNLFLMSLS